MIRAFIAVEVDQKISQRITTVIEQLAPRLKSIRWVGAGNFHLTLKFLGAIDENKIEPIGSALTEALRPFPRLTINAKGLGVFPSPRRARVLWVGLVGEQLEPLKVKVESALMPLGFAPEGKPFTPHLTVGRWRQDAHAEHALEQELASWRDFEFGRSTISEVVFFQSQLKPTGAIYHRLKVIALDSDAMP